MMVRGAERHERVRQLGVERQVGRRRDDVDVAVDQPRHQRPAGEVDHAGARRGDRPVRDLADRAVLDEDVLVGERVVARAVEDARVREEVADKALSRDGRISRGAIAARE